MHNTILGAAVIVLTISIPVVLYIFAAPITNWIKGHKSVK
jgi:hypothetical protein